MTAPPRAHPRDARSAGLLRAAEGRLPSYLERLAELVAIDSGSYSPDGVNRVADWLCGQLTALGFAAHRVRVAAAGGSGRCGDVVLARRTGRLPPADGGRRILLAAHMDTVFADGTAARRPFRVEGRTARGPGVSDDKGGLLAGLVALEILRETGAEDHAEIVFLATPDEEIGSAASRPVIEEAARGADFALALECARENGDLVIGRKGVADFHLTVRGRAAHAGIEPERGAHAALAAAHLVVALQALNGRWEDVTVNVGVLRAGTRTNIVPAEAELHAEVRSATVAGVLRATAAIEAAAARPAVAGTSVEVRQVDLCPPMEAGEPARRMFAEARRLGAGLGLAFDAVRTGGVGDANVIAGTGTPVLDGLGPVGGADHSPEEWLDTATVAPRLALLAGLISSLGGGRGR